MSKNVFLKENDNGKYAKKCREKEKTMKRNKERENKAVNTTYVKFNKELMKLECDKMSK